MGAVVLVGVPLGLTASVLTVLAAIPLNLIYQPVLYFRTIRIDRDIKYVQEHQTEQMKRIVNDFLPLSRERSVTKSQFINRWEARTEDEQLLLVRALTISILLKVSKKKKEKILQDKNFTALLFVPIYNLGVIAHAFFGNASVNLEYDPPKNERGMLKHLVDKNTLAPKRHLCKTLDFVQKLTNSYDNEIPDINYDRDWIFS